eukprot:scaffold5387_cov21-Prasinocladus_malaysianus.AAC.1
MPRKLLLTVIVCRHCCGAYSLAIFDDSTKSGDNQSSRTSPARRLARQAMSPGSTRSAKRPPYHRQPAAYYKRQLRAHPATATSSGTTAST